MAREGSNLRLNWACAPGRSYVVRTNNVPTGAFADFSPIITVPADFAAPMTNYLHRDALSDAGASYYRVRMLPEEL